MEAKVYRQGDLLIRPVNQVNKQELAKDNVIAYGEKTGHSHQVHGDYKLYPVVISEPLRQFHLTVGKGGAVVTHDTHDDIPLSEGQYEIITQRKWDSKTQRSSRQWD